MRADSNGKAEGTARIGIFFLEELLHRQIHTKMVKLPREDRKGYSEKIAKAKDLMILILFCFWGIVLTRE